MDSKKSDTHLWLITPYDLQKGICYCCCILLSVCYHSLTNYSYCSPAGHLRQHTALIPVCAYRGDMSITGEYIDILSFPVCTKFQPTIQDGHLCFVLNINKYAVGLGSLNDHIRKECWQLASSGSSEASRGPQNREQLGRQTHSEDLVRAKHWELGKDLHQYSGQLQRQQSRQLRHVWPQEVDRNLQLTGSPWPEKIEACQRRKYLTDVGKHCGWFPWSLSGILTSAGGGEILGAKLELWGLWPLVIAPVKGLGALWAPYQIWKSMLTQWSECHHKARNAEKKNCLPIFKKVIPFLKRQHHQRSSS